MRTNTMTHTLSTLAAFVLGYVIGEVIHVIMLKPLAIKFARKLDLHRFGPTFARSAEELDDTYVSTPGVILIRLYRRMKTK
jgi:hypothetical protein